MICTLYVSKQMCFHMSGDNYLGSWIKYLKLYWWEREDYACFLIWLSPFILSTAAQVQSKSDLVFKSCLWE